MRFVWRGLILFVVFAGVGLTTAKLVVEHARNAGSAEAQVRLAGAMAGLFAGGAAMVVAGIAMALVASRRRD